MNEKTQLFSPWASGFLLPSRKSQRVKHFPVNPHGRDYIVADLHGCYTELNELLKHVRFRPAVDRLFSVGDLVDRGPHSQACLALLKQPWFHCVLGNHEWMLLNHLESIYEHPAHDEGWLRAFGTTFTARKKWGQQWLPYLKRLPYVIAVGKGALRFNVVHGEILDEQRSVSDETIDEWSFQDPMKAEHRCLWGRTLLQHWKAKKPVTRAHHPLEMSPTYCGHTIVPQCMRLSQQIFLDRGSFLGHQTQFDLEETQGKKPIEPGLVLIQAHSETYWLKPTRPKQAIQQLLVQHMEAP